MWIVCLDFRGEERNDPFSGRQTCHTREHTTTRNEHCALQIIAISNFNRPLESTQKWILFVRDSWVRPMALSTGVLQHTNTCTVVEEGVMYAVKFIAFRTNYHISLVLWMPQLFSVPDSPVQSVCTWDFIIRNQINLETEANFEHETILLNFFHPARVQPYPQSAIDSPVRQSVERVLGI